MSFLGLTLEDWVAIITIVGAVVASLIKGFKWAFHSSYIEENEATQEMFDRLNDTVTTLNNTVESLREDLNRNNTTLNQHEKRLIVLEAKEGIYDDKKD